MAFKNYKPVRFFDKGSVNNAEELYFSMSLFQSRAWQVAWWSVWGSTPGFERVWSGGQGQSDLYVDHYRYRRILPIRCLQFVGTNYRRLSTPRTEYNRFSSERSDPSETSTLLTDFLSINWSEAVFRDVFADSSEIDALKALASDNDLLWRVIAADTTYLIDTRGNFGHYCNGLGRNTRLKLYNRRKILQGCGKIECIEAWPDKVTCFFETLNRFHEKRWGSPCFNASSLHFHELFLRSVVPEGGKPQLSMMLCDGKPISVVYNVLFDGTTYNLQSGFIEGFHRKLALGSLHLGYAIEESFSDPAVHTFDLLAGQGKNTNYKAHIATDKRELISVMLVRSRLLKWLYTLKK